MLGEIFDLLCVNKSLKHIIIYLAGLMKYDRVVYNDKHFTDDKLLPFAVFTISTDEDEAFKTLIS